MPRSRPRVGRPRYRLVAIVALLAPLLAGAATHAPGGAAARAGTDAPPPCRAADLDAAVAHGGVSEHIWLNVALTTVSPATTCALGGGLGLHVLDATGRLLIAAPLPETDPLTLSGGVGAILAAEWGNWCAPDGTVGKHATVEGPLTIALTLPDDDAPLRGHPAGTVAEESPLGGGPLCLEPAQPSWLVAKPLQAAPGGSLGAPGEWPGHHVGARFLAYWRAHGGLAHLGYPLSDAFDQRLADGQTYRVQYFERARLEYHPENAAPNDVLLGQLGRAIHPADPPVQARDDGFFTYFPATGHNVEKRFLGPWERGGLAQFGYPISEPMVERLEDGQEYTVQYFERARFEWHPEIADPAAQVLLGQLGRRVLAAGLQPAVSQSPAAGVCGEAQGAEATVRVNRDVPSPRCQRVLPGQHLRIVNMTDRPVRAQLAQLDVTIAPGDAWADDRPFGTYLAPGVHVLALSAYAGGGAELWVQR